MFRTELLLILSLVVAVKVGQANSEYPEPTQEIAQAQGPCVHAVPFSPDIKIPQSSKPVALPPLLPIHQNHRILCTGDASASLTPSYPATQAPPVVFTTQSPPVVTQSSGQGKFDFECTEGNGYHPVEHECDTFIECKQYRAMKLACPDGLHFNPAAKYYEYACAYPSEVKCMAGNQDQNPKPTYICPNDYGFYSMNDCSKFIRCQEGLVTIMNCPTGQGFNPQTSSCDWTAHVAQCNPDVSKDYTYPNAPNVPQSLPVRELAYQPSVPPMTYYPIVTYPTETPSYSYPPTPPRTVVTQAPPVVVTTQPYPAVTQASGQDFQCKEENGYFPVEHECDTFLECKQNRAMKLACPDGLHFNPAAKYYEYACADPSEVKCVAGYQDQNPKPYTCPNQYGFYSMNDGDGSKFIRCQEGLVTIMNCPTGQAFNPQTSRCDWSANVPQYKP